MVHFASLLQDEKSVSGSHKDELSDDELFLELERQLEPYAGFYHHVSLPEWDPTEPEEEEREEKKEVPSHWDPSQGYDRLLEIVRQQYE